MTASVQFDVHLGETRDSGQGPDRLRVLHVVPQLATGGTEHVLLKVIQGLEASQFEHRICAVRYCDPGIGSQLSAAPIVLGTRCSRLQVSVLQLATAIKQVRPHIVHSRNWGAIEAVVAARLAGVPVVIHSEHGYELEMLSGLPLRRRVFRRFVYGLADAILAVTRELRDYHARQAVVSRERIRVLYNGVDTERFRPRSEVRQLTRQRWGLSANSFVIGTVGRVVRIKNQMTLLKAVEAAVRSGLDAHVLLVGAGPELDNLQKYAGSSLQLSGRVRFTGESTEVSELLNAMDLFVLPSICEGMSNTLLEAMACGLPVLATSVGGNPEIVQEGVNGHLFSPGDVGTLASYLSNLALHRDVCTRQGREARDLAVRQFSLQRMLANYRELYRGLAKKKGIMPERGIAECAG